MAVNKEDDLATPGNAPGVKNVNRGLLIQQQATVQDGDGWRRVVCSLCSTGSDKAYSQVSQVNCKTYSV